MKSLWNNMFYSYEEPKERDKVIHPEFSHVRQVSHPCEENWKTSKIDHERMSYSKVETTFEGKEDMGK